MSSSGDSLDTESLMDRASGQELDTLTKTGIGAVILGGVTLFIRGMEMVFDFVMVPFELFYDVAVTSVEAVFIEPWQIVTGGDVVPQGAIATTAESIANTFSFFSLPVATAMVLGTIFLVIIFLAFSITSNFAPGVGVDNPIWDRFFQTAEEEADDGE